MNVDLKTVIITGGNTGLGYSCAKHIAQNDKSWHIILACRDETKGVNAVKQLKNECSNENISYLKLDLSLFQSVKGFVNEFIKSGFPPPKGIICNAGMSGADEIKLTEDGIEQTFQVNCLSHFLLIDLLLSQLTPPARILFVSSELHRNDGPMKSFRPNYTNANEMAHPNVQGIIKNFGNQRYSTTKLCLLLYMHKLVNHFEEKDYKGITINAFNPGLMPDTGLGGLNKKLLRKYFLKYILPLFSNGAVSNPEKSGRWLAYLLLSKDLEGVTGKYFDRGEMIEPSVESFEKVKIMDLLNTSRDLLHLGN